LADVGCRFYEVLLAEVMWILFHTECSVCC